MNWVRSIAEVDGRGHIDITLFAAAATAAIAVIVVIFAALNLNLFYSFPQ